MKTIIFDLDGTLVGLKPKLRCYANPSQLKLLCKKYRFALVTGASRKETFVALKKFGLLRLFVTNLAEEKFIITSEICAKPKTTGAPFRMVKKAIGDSRAIVIGDSEGDFRGSQKVGLKCILVSRKKSLTQQRQNFKKTIKAAIRFLNKSI